MHPPPLRSFLDRHGRLTFGMLSLRVVLGVDSVPVNGYY
jgi:hypothetical protein